MILGVLYQKFIESLFFTYFRKSGRGFKKIKELRRHLKANDYFSEEVLKDLQRLPLHVYPSRQQMQALGDYLGDDLKKPVSRVKAPPKVALEILKNLRLRKAIECLTLLKYQPEEIGQLLFDNNVIENKIAPGAIKSYLEWFFHTENTSEAELDAFFSKAQETFYFHFHSLIYYRLVSEETALAHLNLTSDAISNTEMIQKLIRTLLQQLETFILTDQLQHMQSLISMINTLSNAYARLGGDPDSDQESLSDYIRIIAMSEMETKSLAEIKEHNRRVLEGKMDKKKES